ncbi:tonB-dependent receptor plug domain protein [Escherichia coli 1-392-07_S3_C1]|nr:tonB-dependent receptor plug domain protein [Escherichia coli 1-392-07_S3_C3]KDW62448.1 tonB-dependent receptor plug domain protein [Escherichia coli 1-392-07_S3_C2]KDX06033.1 tonB-dependent receptor plug domain protein [Escherichia coli 1-392-07_S3_C1]
MLSFALSLRRNQKRLTNQRLFRLSGMITCIKNKSTAMLPYARGREEDVSDGDAANLLI